MRVEGAHIKPLKVTAITWSSLLKPLPELSRFTGLAKAPHVGHLQHATGDRCCDIRQTVYISRLAL